MKIYDLFEGKGTKEQAGYIPRPKNGEKCINCTMWRDPNKCSAVAGDISPNGWCEWYAGGAYGKRGKRVNEAEGLGLTIFDIDETLMRTTAKIKVVKDGKVIRSLTNQEFNSYKLQPGEQFDFGEFRNAEKFRRESQPIAPMIAKLKAILSNAGDSKVIMLTARADFDDKETFLNTFRDLGIDMSRVHVHRAGNLPGNPAENKAVWIRKYLDTGKYSRVRLYDDSMGNIRMFNALAKEYPNIKFYPYLVTHDGSVKTVRETFDTEANWVLELNSRNIQWFSTKIADARIKLTYKRVFPDNVYIEFTRDGRLGVTGEGAQNKIFGAVINHIKQWVDKNKPNKIYFSALKLYGDTSRSSLYKRMVQRFASQNGYEYDVEDEPGEDTFILTKKNVEETRSFQPQTSPLQALINEYLFFSSFGTMEAPGDAKSPDSEAKLNDVITRLAQSNKSLQNLDKQKLEANRDKILNHIHDMMKYAIAHLREHLPPEKFDAKKKQINSVLTKYNAAASTKENFSESKVKYKTPNFEHEWEEAERYPEFRKIGKDAWIELAGKGKSVTIRSAKDINNTDAADPNSFKMLDRTKQSRALDQLKSGTVEMPIIAIYPDGYKELIGGNTRLTAMMAQNGRATVWAFKVPDEVAELAENFADGKKTSNKDKTKSLEEEVAWQNSVSKHIFDFEGDDFNVEEERFLLPISSSILSRLGAKEVRSTVFHVTNFDNLDAMIKNQNTKKALSTFFHMDTGKFSSGVVAGGGLVFELDANVLMAAPEDIETKVDEGGRRWIPMGFIAKNDSNVNTSGMYDDVPRLLASLLQKYTKKPYNAEDNDVYGDWKKLGKTLNSKGDGKTLNLLIKDFMDGIYEIYQKHKDQLMKLLRHHLADRTPMDSTIDWDEIIANEYKIKKIHVLDSVTLRKNPQVLDRVKSTGIEYDIWKKGSQLGSHIKKTVDKEKSEYIAQQQKDNPTTKSSNFVVKNPPGFMWDEYRIFNLNKSGKIDLGAAILKLSPAEQEWAKLRWQQGLRLGDIGKKYNLSNNQAIQKYQPIHDKIRQHLGIKESIFSNLQSIEENFADGKNPGRKGLSKRMGINTKASVSSLRKTAKNSSGEKQRMAHWLANMKSGRKKK